MGISYIKVIQIEYQEKNGKFFENLDRLGLGTIDSFTYYIIS